jgi:hypothetical protein
MYYICNTDHVLGLIKLFSQAVGWISVPFRLSPDLDCCTISSGLLVSTGLAKSPQSAANERTCGHIQSQSRVNIIVTAGKGSHLYTFCVIEDSEQVLTMPGQESCLLKQSERGHLLPLALPYRNQGQYPRDWQKESVPDDGQTKRERDYATRWRMPNVQTESAPRKQLEKQRSSEPCPREMNKGGLNRTAVALTRVQLIVRRNDPPVGKTRLPTVASRYAFGKDAFPSGATTNGDDFAFGAFETFRHTNVNNLVSRTPYLDPLHGWGMSYGRAMPSQ